MSEFHAVAEQILITSDAGGVDWIPQDSEWAACCPMASHGSGRSRWLDSISCARAPLREDDLQQRRGLSFFDCSAAGLVENDLRLPALVAAAAVSGAKRTESRAGRVAGLCGAPGARRLLGIDP